MFSELIVLTKIIKLVKSVSSRGNRIEETIFYLFLIKSFLMREQDSNIVKNNS
jgi:hypothetical protein